MSYAEEIKGFDPDHIFYNHIVAFGLIPSLINNIIYGEEEGDSHDPNVQEVDINLGDIETIISTTEPHKERFHHSKSMLITYFFPYQFFIQLFFFFN
jgi:hypothetical protein